MEKRIGGLLVEVAPPERPKFKSPLLMVHGLWSGSWCWRQWATDFSNLGWECWAINFKGRLEREAHRILKELTLSDCVADLQAVISAASFPPVLIGHSIGGLIALKAAEREKLSALVLLSVLPPSGIELVRSRQLRLLRLKYWPLVLLGRPFRPEAKDLRPSWIASVPAPMQADIMSRIFPDSAHLFAHFFVRRRVAVDPARISCPTLATGGSDDRVVPVETLRDTARRLGSDFKEYPGHGHWLMGEGGGAEIVREIHRWVVQGLGEEILLAPFSEER